MSEAIHQKKKILILLTTLVAVTFPAFGKTGAQPQVQLDPSVCSNHGERLADGAIPSPSHVANDAYCAQQLVTKHAPNGVLTVFGSARAKPGMKAYDITRRFTYMWTKRWGKQVPVMSGGGPGIMEAANRGAKEAGGKSLAIGSFFGGGMEKPNEYTTHGYLASSFAQREADLIDYARVVVVAPGGFGTEWEIYETLSKMQTRKKQPVPMVFLGGRQVWQTLIDRVHALKAMKTISAQDLELFYVAESPKAALAYIEKQLNFKTTGK